MEFIPFFHGRWNRALPHELFVICCSILETNTQFFNIFLLDITSQTRIFQFISKISNT